MKVVNVLYGLIVFMMFSQLISVYLLHDRFSSIVTWIMIGCLLAASIVFGGAKYERKDDT
ncbi:hypothetical protein ACE1TH_13510 [Shouchella sp. JSM 1781072]|uniref:hypothetical protein n=1 Tax=Shouchella sp. JSM 1781072 TaxID=3344581 RepID=UPI0035BF4CA5